MKKKLWLMVALALALAVANASPALGVETSDGTGNQHNKPTQSETEFVVAIDPEFADKVVSGQAELFAYEDKTAALPSGQKDEKKLKKLPPGLLKKGLDGKEEHARNLERYMKKHMGSGPVLMTVEVEDKGMIEEARAAVEKCEGVLYTDPQVYYYASGFNDPRSAEQWGLEVISAYNAWNGNTNLPKITIAILDSGVRLTHEDLAASISEKKWDFIDDDSNPSDLHGHGTHVAGIAAAICDNSRGIASPAGGAKIMPVRVLDAGGEGSLIGVASGIRYAADNGADVINMSLGSYMDVQTMRDAVNYALAKGCLVVASAGNDGLSAVEYPARYDGVIIAASLNVSSVPGFPYAESRNSNYDRQYAYRTVHAPGQLILSTYAGSNTSYNYMSGTSMASAYVSGVAAAIKARGGYTGSLFNAVLSATYTVPRGKMDILGGVSVSGTMKILDYDKKSSTPEYVTVAFEPNGGGPAPAPQSVPVGGLAAAPTQISRDGYLFIGWYAEPGFSGEPFNFMSPVGYPTVLYAKWEPAPRGFRVGQETYGGLNAALAAAENGGEITLLADMQHTGAIEIVNKIITFNLAGHSLNVFCFSDDAGLYVEGGEVRIAGGGAFNINCAAECTYGINAVDSVVEATNVSVGMQSCAIRAEGESSVTAYGNVISGLAGVEITSIGNSTVTIDGKLNAPEFAALQGAAVNQKDCLGPSTRAGYVTYYRENDEGAATLWVRQTDAGYSKYDLNKDNKVGALDLGIMLLYCGFDKDAPDWGDVIKVNDSRGAGVCAGMCDVNGDGLIDMLDLLDLFIHYTK
ncbi:MAG: S8 family serine peptidase [Clostridiales bacterium]|nr:S8 family serine peptidase [Clostridiales bacterium]